ncbi:unnamed protein product [Discosporangium mesarthrocarpum]
MRAFAEARAGSQWVLEGPVRKAREGGHPALLGQGERKGKPLVSSTQWELAEAANGAKNWWRNHSASYMRERSNSSTCGTKTRGTHMMGGILAGDTVAVQESGDTNGQENYLREVRALDKVQGETDYWGTSSVLAGCSRGSHVPCWEVQRSGSPTKVPNGGGKGGGRGGKPAAAATAPGEIISVKDEVGAMLLAREEELRNTQAQRRALESLRLRRRREEAEEVMATAAEREWRAECLHWRDNKTSALLLRSLRQTTSREWRE